MNPRAFIILAAITAATVIGAAIGVAATYTAAPTVREEALMFPRLIDRLDDVASIVVRHTKGELTMNRGESGWGLAEKGGYPIAADKVRKAMVQLAGLRLLAPKTTKAERFPRLQVEDVTAEGAKSKVLEMKDKDGTSLARVIVGKYRFDLGGDGKNGVYVRRPGENRAWLARGGLNISQDVTVWLQRSIVDVLAKRVREVANVAPDDTVLTVYKMKPSDKAFVSLDIPADAKRKKNAGTTLNDMGSALSLLDLQDVVPAADMDFSGDGVSRAEFQTFDGLIIRIALIERKDGKDTHAWATFEALADAASAVKVEGDDAKDMKSPGDVAKEAAEINDRVAGWAYRLSDYKAKVMRTRLADLLEAEPAS